MLIVYLMCLLSLLSFILYGLDKRKAMHHKWRISELTLLLFSVFGGIGGLLGMLLFHHKTRKWKFRILVPLFAIIDVLVIAFFLWTSFYYHADEAALAALQSDNIVHIEKTGTGWFFDGPSDEDVLIFYPGAKVEEKAYAPLLRRLAEEKMDVCLVKMPFRLAFFGMNKAGKIMAHTDYSRFYIGGHSLGGAMAASYAAGHESDFSGLILLASYPTDETGIDTLLIYGSEDEILNVDRFTASLSLLSGRWEEAVIEGGNHAGFGNYGSQKGDGKAGISPLEQQEKTIEYISEFVKAK